MNTNYVYQGSQVGEIRQALLYAAGPASYAVAGDPVYNPGSNEYINFPCGCMTVSGNYQVHFVPTAVGLNQVRAGAPSPGQSGWTAEWRYSETNAAAIAAGLTSAGIPLSLGALSAACTQSTYAATCLVTVATTTPPPLGSFISLSNGASSYGILFTGAIVYVAAVVAGTSYSFYFGQGSAASWTVNTDTLKYQVVQASATNALQIQALAAPITGVLATTALLTITQANSLKVGQFVYLNGPFKTASLFALGAIVQVASASTTGWTANWQGTIIAQTSSETAVASLLITNGNAPVMAYPYEATPTAVITNSLAAASSTTVAGLLTLTAAQAYQPGMIIAVQNLGTGTALNGSIATVIAASLTQAIITANCWTVTKNTGAETAGYASVLVTGAPVSGQVGTEVIAGTNLAGETVQFGALISSL